MLLALVMSVYADEYTPDPVMEVVVALDDKAVARFEACLELADQHQRWTTWQDHCLTSLAYLEPYRYSFPKQEARAEAAEPLIVPRAAPARP